ncbi:hypothetical protein [Cedecea neteri]|uniref:Uncharacterized protein n=1 Tax=Cedecea neteri TaxID=158822 RepID=A0A291DW51_9ENTR|nr:hypothetical protein [Cedecea neteri]ATF92060.1 hypothetical protein CO704_08140 [Cedecea neteri]
MLNINDFMKSVDIDNTFNNVIDMISLRAIEIYFFNNLSKCKKNLNEIIFMNEIHSFFIDKDYYKYKDINPIEDDSFIETMGFSYSNQEISTIFSSMSDVDFLNFNVIGNKKLLKDLVKKLELRFDFVYSQIIVEDPNLSDVVFGMLNDAHSYLSENITCMYEGIKIIEREKGEESCLLKITIDSYNRSIATFLDSCTRAFMVGVLSYSHLYIVDVLNNEGNTLKFYGKIERFAESVKNHAILNITKKYIDKYFSFDNANNDFVINGINLMEDFIIDRNAIMHQTDPIIKEKKGIVAYYENYCDFLNDFLNNYIFNDECDGKIAMKKELIVTLDLHSQKEDFLRKAISILNDREEIDWWKL